MSRAERIATIKFLEKLKKDLLIQVLQNIAEGNDDNKDKWAIIKDINKQVTVDKELLRTR